ncbi:hypothetical protein [Rugamonas rubra]|uniref:Uncharacterized protein n=1 Tax=Rugamonas rubra TaxID=758825 RepID=A0A1I4MA44_9BURK|nr:hypothetical protein [Rugamonas rubra]SFM00192.1 hypothetical protein SAMN02982985_02361 [Rugamonas rubra]
MNSFMNLQSSFKGKARAALLPQGMSYWRPPAGTHSYLYLCDNGDKRIKIFEVYPASGAIALAGLRQLADQLPCDHFRLERTDAALS